MEFGPVVVYLSSSASFAVRGGVMAAMFQALAEPMLVGMVVAALAALSALMMWMLLRAAPVGSRVPVVVVVRSPPTAATRTLAETGGKLLLMQGQADSPSVEQTA